MSNRGTIPAADVEHLREQMAHAPRAAPEALTKREANAKLLPESTHAEHIGDPFWRIAGINVGAPGSAAGERQTKPRGTSDGATATPTMEHSVSTTAPHPDATEIGSVSTGGASGERIPVAPGTPSGALPAATATRSLAHEDSTRRGPANLSMEQRRRMQWSNR